MANISISLNLSAYDGFKYLCEKDPSGKKVYYAAVPVTKLFNPSGTNKVYATAVMIPTPNSEFSDFMLKPMLSGRELQSMSPEDFRAIPTIGSGKYLEKSASKDIVKGSAKAAETSTAEMAEIFGHNTDEPDAMSPVQPTTYSTWDPRSVPDQANTLYYIFDRGAVIATIANYKAAYDLCRVQVSPTVELHRYEDNRCTGRWNKAQILNFNV